MSSLDYLADLVESATKRGYVILKDRCRHTTHTRRPDKDGKKRVQAPKITADEEKQIVAYSEAGKNLTEIVVLSGRAKSSVWKVLVKHGRV